MTAPRKFTDEQCKDLAAWFNQLRSLGTVREKARALNVSVPALYDAISRGNGCPTAATRYKISEAEMAELIDLLDRS